MSVSVRFEKDFPNPKNLKKTTDIIKVLRSGDVVEIEFDGMPLNAELDEISEMLGLKRITINPTKKIKRARSVKVREKEKEMKKDG